MEEDDLIDPVQELGAEVRAERRLDEATALLVGGRLRQLFGPEVRGHDHERVAEIDGTTLPVGQPSIVHQLEENVHDVRVGLLDLVEQHDGVGARSDRLGQLPALLVPDVPRRGPDQAGDGVALHVLAHVDADERPLGVEEERGERLCELGLAHAGRPDEQERPHRTVRVGQPGARAPNGFRDGRYRLVLAHHPLAELVLHPKEPLPFPLEHPAHGNAAPPGDDLRDVLLADLFAEHPGRRGPGGRSSDSLELLLELGDPSVAQPGGGLEVAGPFGPLLFGPGLVEIAPQRAQPLDLLLLPGPLRLKGRFPLLEPRQLASELNQTFAARRILLLRERGALDLELADPAAELVELGRAGIEVEPDTGGGLVHGVDRLVRQVPVRNVPGPSGSRPRRAPNRGCGPRGGARSAP